MPNQPSIAAVIFDIGGVLLQLDYREAFQALGLGSNAETHAAMTQLGNSADYDAFERGALTENDYRLSICRQFQRDISAENFRKVWNGIVGKPFEGIVDLLAQLRARTKIYALSNSNETHFASIETRFPWLFEIEEVFSSHRLGFRKPDPRIYQRCLELVALPANRVLFFDDRQENVAAAKAAGMHAMLVRNSPGDILTGLKQLQLL